MKNLAILITLALFSSASFATTVGLSAHPFTMKKQVVTTEFNNYLNNGSGTGITAKYFQRVNDNINFDAGVGVTDGERSNRFFAGADFQLFPDYGRQPRVSVKGLLETLSFEGERINSFGAAPTISKGFSFWGNEAFPFLAVPIRVSLNEDEGTYESSSAVAMGITGRMPVEGYQNLIYNFETNFSLRNSYQALVLGISLPIQ
jgi:hypothetical protein